MPHQFLASVGPLIGKPSKKQQQQEGKQQKPQNSEDAATDTAKNAQDDTKQQNSQQRTVSAEAADVKAQALEAIDSAFCQHIYITALQHLEQGFSYESVNQQFSSILDDDYDNYDANSTIANHFVNLEKNRYRDVVPYDSNRVALPSRSSNEDLKTCAGQVKPLHRSTSAPSSDLDGSRVSYDDTYINASFISDPAAVPVVNGDSSYSGAVGYIATQGPLPNTVADFWRMVLAHDISAIVMATELTMNNIGHGSGRALCAAYFPDHLGDCLRLPGGVTVTCVHKTRLSESLLLRQLEVAVAQQPQQEQKQPQQQDKRLWVNHYKIADWPDYGVPPDTLSVRALSHALDGCRRAGCKIVVHCSAGVGRTGTFIAVDVLLQRLHSLGLQAHGSVTDDDVCTAVDVQALVAGLRKQRRGTVQTSEQYAFIWQAVIDELRELLFQEQQQQELLRQVATLHVGS